MKQSPDRVSGLTRVSVVEHVHHEVHAVIVHQLDGPQVAVLGAVVGQGDRGLAGMTTGIKPRCPAVQAWES